MALKVYHLAWRTGGGLPLKPGGVDPSLVLADRERSMSWSVPVPVLVLAIDGHPLLSASLGPFLF